MATAFILNFNYWIFSVPSQENRKLSTGATRIVSFPPLSPERYKLVHASLFATPLKPAGVLYLRISIKISNLNFQHKR